MAIQYQVTFTPGIFKYYKNQAPSSTPRESWIVGREDNGDIIAFTFDETSAKHVCLALNLVHNYICGYGNAQMDILRELQRFRH